MSASAASAWAPIETAYVTVTHAARFSFFAAT